MKLELLIGILDKKDTMRCPISIARAFSWVKTHQDVLRRTLLLSVIYLLPAISILQPILFDPDVWWHLRTGKWIVDNGAPPATDPFSVYGEGKPWIAYSWLFDVWMYGLVYTFGEQGIIFCTLAFSLLILMVLHKLLAERVRDFTVLCGVLALCSFALVKVFTPRPWLWTILGVALTLDVILALREGRICRRYRLLPAVYALWANIHVQFVVGLGLLGLACLAPILDHVVRSFSFKGLAEITWGSGRWMKMVGLMTLCGLATLVNPYHVHVYSVVFDYASQAGFRDVISEMQAPTFRFLADWAMLVLFSYSLIMLGRRSSWSYFDVLLLGTAAYFAFRGQREAWLLVVAAVSVIRSYETHESAVQPSGIPTVPLVPVALCVIVGVVCLIGYRGLSNAKIQENTARLYPVQAAGFVEEQHYAGQLYNHFDWGGYLIWRLPHLKVSMDGRGHVHGDTRVKQSILAWNGGPHWRDDQDINASEVVIAKKETALTAILRLDPRFRMAYEDEIAVVFDRSEQTTGHSSSPVSPASPSSSADTGGHVCNSGRSRISVLGLPPFLGSSRSLPR